MVGEIEDVEKEEEKHEASPRQSSLYNNEFQVVDSQTSRNM